MGFSNATLANNIEVHPVPQKGNGLVIQTTSADIGQSALLTVPHDLVLNADAVEEYAKEDRNFRALVDACGHKVSAKLSMLTEMMEASRVD